jgi:hypothetical protein
MPTVSMISKTIRIGYQNLNKGLIGKADDIDILTKELNLDFFAGTETNLRITDTAPIKGVVADSRGESEDIDKRGQDGTILIKTTDEWTEKVINEQENGLWVTAKIGDVVFTFCYLPPRLGRDVLDKFNDMIADTSRSYPGCPYIIVGDFNARHIRFGDHANTTDAIRKTWIEEWIEDDAWTRMEPTQGKWTSITQSMGGVIGKGIPDLVFLNDLAIGRTSNLVVHEQDLTINSDHRPISFNVEISDQFIKPPFERINVRNILENQLLYREVLKNTAANTDRQLMALMAQTDRAFEEREPWSWQQRKDMANQATKIVTDWMTNVTKDIAGVRKFHGGATRAPMKERHVEIYEAIAKEARRVSLDETLPLATRNIYWKRAKRSRRYLKKMLLRSRKRLYNKTADERLYDPAGEATRIACARKRTSRSHCGLDPDKMDEHCAHFETTLGALPTGTDQPNAHWIQETDPTRMRVPLDPQLIAGIISIEEMEGLLHQQPTGKAAGNDGVYGEMLRYGDNEMGSVIWLLVRLLMVLQATPDEWNISNVALIWKRKGSKASVADYRPISLVSRLRMVFESILRPRLLHICSRTLDIAQGGFRDNRGTIDQVFNLHELITRHPNLTVTYLDMKAAYDCVNRNLIWSDLAENPLDPDLNFTRGVLIPLMRSLFDFNTAHLLVLGFRSDGIEVRRGLLQGTVLAPPLYNISINSLSGGLRRQFNAHCLQVGMYKLNALHFADDTAVFAICVMVVQQLLDFCAEWADCRGATFNASKSLAVSREPVQLTLGGEAVPQVASAKYLGVVMTPTGVDMRASLSDRVKDASKTANWLFRTGMNAYGFRYLESLYMYPLFIRSQLEYGMALRPLHADEIEDAQKLQNKCLRTLFGVTSRTSKGGLHLLGSVMPMQNRNYFLNASFLWRLHHSTDVGHLAVSTYREGYQRLYPQNSKSLMALAQRQNPYWQSDLLRRPRWKNLSVDHPLAPRHEIPPFGSAVSNNWRIPETVVDEYHELVLGQLQTKEKSRTQKILTIPKSRSDRHPLIQSGAIFSRRLTRPIMLWHLGAVATHQACIKCGRELSRRHAIECSGVLQDLIPILGRVQVPNHDAALGATALDVYIGNLKYTRDRGDKVAAVAAAIERIRVECAGYKPIFDASSTTAEQEIEYVLSDDARPGAPPRTAADVQTDNELRQTVQQNFEPIRYEHVPVVRIGRGGRARAAAPAARGRGRGRGAAPR